MIIKAHTLLASLASLHTGQEHGVPDIELKCKIGQAIDVVAIDPKNTTGANWLNLSHIDT